MGIVKYIVHADLNPALTLGDIEHLCNEACRHGFARVCVPPVFIKKVNELLTGSQIQLATVIGFPFGYSVIEAKLAEIVMAIVDGADEMNMVVNTIAVKNHDWQYLAKEINTILPIVKGKGKMFNLILETGLLNKEEIITCCDIFGAAGVDAIVAGTGYAVNDVTVDAVQLLRKHLPSALKINVCGGIKNYSFALQLTDAGADLLICSNGVELLQEQARQN